MFKKKYLIIASDGQGKEFECRYEARKYAVDLIKYSAYVVYYNNAFGQNFRVRQKRKLKKI